MDLTSTVSSVSCHCQSIHIQTGKPGFCRMFLRFVSLEVVSGMVLAHSCQKAFSIALHSRHWEPRVPYSIYVMSDIMECGKEAVKQSTPLVWEEKVAEWLNKRKLLGTKVVAKDLYASPAIVSVLREYERSCMQPEGKVTVLFGEFGTGKSCALYAVVRGPAEGSFCPRKSILVTTSEQKSGNEWMERLRSEMQYPETMKANYFGDNLIRTVAEEKSYLKKVLEKIGKAPQNNASHPQIVVRDLVDSNHSFDDAKKPVIAIDNVEFDYEDGQRHAEHHSEFFDFALAVKDAAHSAGVVVILGTKNLALCKALSILNGFSKIAPADISCSQELEAYDEGHKVTETGRRHPRTLALDGTMGWTIEAMEKCLISKFPVLPPAKAKEIAKSYADVGNIRDAVEVATKEVCLYNDQIIPKVTTKSTGTCTSIDSGELSRPSLVDLNHGTTGDESDDDQAWLDAKMARCGMDC